MEMKQQLKLSQQLVMTPQLQQAIKLLQLSRLELIDEIRKELDANPVLADEDTDPRMRVHQGDLGIGEQGFGTERGEARVDRMEDRLRAQEQIGSKSDERTVKEIDWEQFLENRILQQPVSNQRSGFEELPAIDQNLTKRESLADHLRWQLHLSDFTDTEKAFAELVISSLDENGFLDTKASYQDSIADLEASLKKNPVSKNAVFNLGILYEQVGSFDAMFEAFCRFLGRDLEPQLYAKCTELNLRIQEAIQLTQFLSHFLGKKLDELAQKADFPKDPSIRETLNKLRGEQWDGDVVRDGLRIVRDLGGDIGDLAFKKLEHELSDFETQKFKGGSGLLDSLLEYGFSSLHRGELPRALSCFRRVLGLDLEPHEKMRGEQFFHKANEARRDGAAFKSEMGDISIEYLAEQSGLDPEDAPLVLKLMQQWDPVGVCARDMRECLLIQAEVYGYDFLEMTIIEKHLHHLEKRNYAAIAKDLKISVDEVYDAVKEIQKLESRPGRNFIDSDEKSIGITPDVYISRDGEKWNVTDNDRGVQRLYINETLMKQMLKDPNAKDFIGEKLRHAQWLIRSIEQRRKTILRVTECIVEKQRDFFERGIAHLKPMVLRDVAESLGLHESTISRVTTNKYVHTPQGLFELKYFFNSSIRRASEDDIASESVKQSIKKIIDEENKVNPLSDQAIVHVLLEKEGIDIARRTVAKYREMMRILPSSKRKKLF